jgi:AAA15 family ATPase/GTPase
MIKSIKVSNYKNLDGFEFDGFGRINLITGKNNIGKSNLLEAIHLGVSPSEKAFSTILLSRGIRINSKTMSQLENSFMNKEKSIDISIDSYKISIEIDDKIETFLKNDKDINELNLFDDIIHSNNKSKIIHIKKNNREIFTILPMDIGFTTKKADNIFNINDSFFLFSQLKTNNKVMAENFTEIIREKKQKREFLETIKIVDRDIEEIQIFADNGEPNIYLTKNGRDLPLSFFGDATIKIFDIFSKVFLSKGQVIIIDEIENGIYYKNHIKFWEQLIEISESTNSQIFATTHSIEMIKAFYEVSKELEDCKLLKLVIDRKNRKKLQEFDKEFLEYELSSIKSDNVLR